MLHVPTGAQSYGSVTPSYGTVRPAATMGTSVTPGTSGYGSWAQVLSALTYDVYGLMICMGNNNTTATNRHTIARVGVDTAGGTSYTETIGGLLCGSAANYAASAGEYMYFPLFIPAGSTVAVSAYSTVTTAFRIWVQAFAAPPNPSMIRKCSFVEAIGQSGLTGVAVTPGTASEGAWTSLGTTTKRCWWWQFGCQIDLADTSWNTNTIFVDIAVGDVSNKDIILLDQPVSTTNAEVFSIPPFTAGCEWDVPAGSTIYARAQVSGTADTLAIVAYGAG